SRRPIRCDISKNADPRLASELRAAFLRYCDAGSNRAGDARSTQPAIALRVLGKVLLVVVLGEVEDGAGDDLGGDRSEAALLPLRRVRRLYGLGDVALTGIGDVDAGPVLRSDVVALPHALRRVVRLEEGADELFEADLLRIIDDEHDLVMAGHAAADLA